MGDLEDQLVPAAALSSAEDVVEQMELLVRGEGALALRIAETLASLKEMDLRMLGYTSWSAFVAEEVGYDGSWARQLVRLARSDLHLVKVALCRGVIPLSAAVKASAPMDVEEQLAWVEAVASGTLLLRKPASGARVDVENADEARAVHDARIRARTVLGYACSDEVADRHVRQCWKDGVDGPALVQAASEPRDPPVPDPVVWDHDPAAEVLGPRVVPADATTGRTLLHTLLALRRTRRIEVGLLYDRVVTERLHRVLGFDTLEAWVRQFPLTQRALQKCWEDALAVAFYPELADAVAHGLDLGRAWQIYDVATEDNVARWLRVAGRTSLTELRRAVAWATQTQGERVLEQYEHALVEAEANDAHAWVALRAARRPEKPPRRLEGLHPDQVEAARWYLENVRLPKLVGFQKVKVRERFTCESPLCNRTSLRTHAHHGWFKSLGGPDEDWNARCVCSACHLCGLHTNGMITLAIVRGGPDVWRYPDGRCVVVS